MKKKNPPLLPSGSQSVISCGDLRFHLSFPALINLQTYPPVTYRSGLSQSIQADESEWACADDPAFIDLHSRARERERWFNACFPRPNESFFFFFFQLSPRSRQRKQASPVTGGAALDSREIYQARRLRAPEWVIVLLYLEIFKVRYTSFDRRTQGWCWGGIPRRRQGNGLQRPLKVESGLLSPAETKTGKFMVLTSIMWVNMSLCCFRRTEIRAWLLYQSGLQQETDGPVNRKWFERV